MRFRPFGPEKQPVAIVGQGTWRVKDPDAAQTAIRAGIGLGMTHIDTAELYEEQSGSETMLADVVTDEREKIFLASKVLPENATRKGVASACKDSLVRLGVDELDLYYLHWRKGCDLEEALMGLADVKDAGWVRHIGVSNFGIDDLEAAESILGKGSIAADQVLYNLGTRGAEEEVLPWCRDRGAALVAYSPFGGGSMPSGDARAALDRVADEVDATAHQVALAFLLRNEEVFTIPKAESVAHVRDNAGGDLHLSADAVDALDEAFPVRPGIHAR